MCRSLPNPLSRKPQEIGKTKVLPRTTTMGRRKKQKRKYEEPKKIRTRIGGL
jgi:hypothetical protein